jgi:sterol desaturase/sphingolipid hydroxylase (fatty acid hydroxylase superfamily)
VSWLPRPLDPSGYFFWLLVISLGCLVLERLRPWRGEQRLLRRGFAQDVFWLVFNGHFAGMAISYLAAVTLTLATPAFDWAESVRAFAGAPLWAQGLVAFVLKDLLEWGVHNLLHRVPFLWELHKVHHTIEELDWIGNFRFHWGEIVVYRALTYFLLALLGTDPCVLLVLAGVSTAIGHLNHSNLNITWGPLRYVLNSPRMHVWHHDVSWPADRPHGVNFAIGLSLWDWCFGTAHWPTRDEAPTQQPARLGFVGIDRYPSGTLGRLLFPLSLLWTRRRLQQDPADPARV